MTNENRSVEPKKSEQKVPSQVTVFSGPSDAMPHARDLTEMQHAKASHQVVAMYPGGGGVAEAAKDYAALFKVSCLARRKFEKIGSSRKLDLTSNEGLDRLGAICRENNGAVVTFGYKPRKDAVNRIALALKEIQGIAKDCGVHIVMFASDCGDLRDELEEFSDEFVEVLACESDPDAAVAVAISHVEHQVSFFSGKHRKMWQFKKGSEDKLCRSSSEFVHQKLGMRVKHEMRRHGSPLQEIANLFEVHVSTISRDLQNMPTGEKIAEPMTKHRLATLAEHLGLKLPEAPESVTTAAEPEKRVETKVEDNGWDDDDMQKPSKSSEDEDDFGINDVDVDEPVVKKKRAGFDVPGLTDMEDRPARKPAKKGVRRRS